VGTVRSRLESTGEIPQLEKRAGSDGRVRRAEPAKPVKPVKKSGAGKPEPEEYLSTRSRLKAEPEILSTAGRRPASVAMELLTSYKAKIKGRPLELTRKAIVSKMEGIFEFSRAMHKAKLISDRELSQIEKMLPK
jgi:hypothetical protein